MPKQIQRILKLLRREVKQVVWRKGYRNAFEVLVFTVLSQRTRDENTIKATKKLFSKYKTPKQVANAPLKEIQNLIHSSGFYKVKSKYVKELSKKIEKEFNGVTPQSIEKLLSLPGVGRKTANCVLVYAFRKPAIPVDVHVHRISNRLGVVKTKLPEETEQELMKAVPKKNWVELNELMAKFGQRKCFPRNPNCFECNLNKLCKFFKDKTYT